MAKKLAQKLDPPMGLTSEEQLLCSAAQNKNAFLLIPTQSPDKPDLPCLNILPAKVPEVPSDVWFQPVSL